MIGIIDYKAGNLTSVKRALDYLSVQSAISADPDAIAQCERIIFPGVGNAASAMATLRERGLDKALISAFSMGVPILGICLGAQVGHPLCRSTKPDRRRLNPLWAPAQLRDTTNKNIDYSAL